MLIIDSHLDIAYNALDWDRDLLQSIRRIREAEASMPQKGRGLNVVNFEELRRGNIGLFLSPWPAGSPRSESVFQA